MVEIARTKSGKPEVLDDQGCRVLVSLAHDRRYCVGVAGEGEQGVDIEVVTKRSEQDWQELLGTLHTGILDELARSESADRAGTRIWAVLECLYKALGVRKAALSVFRRDGDALVLRARTVENAECYVLTVPMTFTLGPERILAVVVTPHSDPQPEHELPTTKQLNTRLEAVGYTPSSYAMDSDEKSGQFILRWPLTFKEGANLDRTVYVTYYAEWMGKVREIAMQPIAEPFVAQLATGRWGLITNHSEILILGEPRPGDVIEARFSVNPARNLPESAVDLHFDFRRIDRNGLQERVAFGEMRTTWVALLGHGQVKAEPLPDYFRDFVDARTPLGAEIFRPDPMPEALRDPHRGPHRFRRPPGPVRGPNIALRVFDTCLQDSNMVGNIYFSNYYMWQARIVDHYVQPLVPDIYRAMGAMGELRCIRTRVDHLADAMPFEEIEVVMSLEELYDGGVTLGFDYFRIQPDQTRQKLAFGEQECVWLAKKKGETVVSQLPAALMEDLRRRTG